MKALILAILFVSCKNYEGNMNVSDHLVYKSKSGETQVLVIGDYQAKIKLRKNKSITIKAKNIFENVKIKIKLPKNIDNFLTNKSEEELSFDLPKNVTGQPFSMKGSVISRTILGEIETETQVCSNSPRWDIDCRWWYEDISHRGHGPYSYCNSIPTGTREVTFREDVVISELKMVLANDEVINANINAKSEKKNKVYLEIKDCVL